MSDKGDSAQPSVRSVSQPPAADGSQDGLGADDFRSGEPLANDTLDSGMTMDEVDLLNAMHAEGVDDEQAQVASDISALLQDLAEQGGLTAREGDVIMDDSLNDTQADQDALLEAVRALEGMDPERFVLAGDDSQPEGDATVGAPELSTESVARDTVDLAGGPQDDVARDENGSQRVTAPSDDSRPTRPDTMSAPLVPPAIVATRESGSNRAISHEDIVPVRAPARPASINGRPPQGLASVDHYSPLPRPQAGPALSAPPARPPTPASAAAPPVSLNSAAKSQPSAASPPVSVPQIPQASASVTLEVGNGAATRADHAPSVPAQTTMPSSSEAGTTSDPMPPATMPALSAQTTASRSTAPATSTSSVPAPSLPPPTEIDDTLLDPALFADSEGFDPDTLANLAALSRIANEEDDDSAPGPTPNDADTQSTDLLAVPSADRHRRKSRDQEPELSRDQVRALIEGLNKGDKGARDVEKDKEEEQTPGDVKVGTDKEDEKLKEVAEVEQEDGKDAEYKDEDEEAEPGKKKKRKRNRTTLSCTECHRRCDRNIPCSRCVARGVPAMCKMEYPNLPPAKKRKNAAELPLNHELGLRVQALETLLRAGSSLDSGAANIAAKDTIIQATRAALAGNADAGSALASLTTAAGGDLSKMEAAEQNGLLMEVLQQLTYKLSSASMARTTTQEDVPDDSNDPWSIVPEAAAESLLIRPRSQKDGTEGAETYMNLAVPGFREDNGNVFLPPTVKHVEKAMRTENILSKEPLSTMGDPRFLAAATKFAYGADSPGIKKDLVASIQSISLTGALRIASAFLARLPSPEGPRCIYVPDPLSWEDEVAIKSAGPALEVRQMRFLDPRGHGVDWEGMREDLMNAAPGSAVMLYVGGSMPSGAELSASLWRLLALVMLERQLVPLCILAFQGLASGDPGRDAQPMRFMVHEGLPVLLVQSFDSTMGIHADSPSVVSLVTQSPGVKSRVESQFRAIARGLYLHPTPWGAHVVQAIMNNARLYPAWLNEIKAMSGRLKSVRDKLYDLIVNKFKTPGNWIHIKRAHGMYCSTLLSPSQVRSIAQTKTIHLLPDGSVSLGSLNASRIETLSRAIDWAVRTSIAEAEETRARAIAMEEAINAAREKVAKEEAEAAARAAKEAEARAMEEDAALMEQSIAEAMMRQAAEVQAQEREKEMEEERREMNAAIEKAQQGVEIQRRADEILASIGKQ